MSNEEIWKPMIFKDQPTGYEISSHGRVLDGSGEVCKFNDYKGYYTLNFKINGKKKELQIRRLVALNFIENPNNFYHIRHLDGNMFNNNVDNLRWVSHQSKELMEEVNLNEEEIWKPLIFDDHQSGYTISSHGNVRDSNNELCKFGNYKGKHYIFDFKINGKRTRLIIHRLVALNFIDNPDNFNFLQHVDGNMFNNNVDNLKWVSSIRWSIPIEIKNKELIQAGLNDANWRPVYINGELTNYHVSNEGQIRVANTLKVCSLSTRTDYVTCQLTHKDKKYSKQVHIIVAEAFIPNDNVEEKKQVNHINYNTLDNRVENLEWVTASENMQHAILKADRKSKRIPIIRRNLDGTKPVRYEYVNQAKEEFGSDVCKCLAGKKTQAGGYTWTYENEREKNEIEIDLDEFKPVEHHPNFLISKDAKIYNSSKKKFVTHLSRGSYMRVNLDTKLYTISRLVADHFITKPGNYNDKWIVSHKDGDKMNNRAENLEWMSLSDNMKNIFKNGSSKRARFIVQKDLNGNVIREYINASHASRALGRIVHAQILRVCKNPKKPILYGFIWEFK